MEIKYKYCCCCFKNIKLLQQMNINIFVPGKTYNVHETDDNDNFV